MCPWRHLFDTHKNQVVFSDQHQATAVTSHRKHTDFFFFNIYNGRQFEFIQSNTGNNATVA